MKQFYLLILLKQKQVIQPAYDFDDDSNVRLLTKEDANEKHNEIRDEKQSTRKRVRVRKRMQKKSTTKYAMKNKARVNTYVRIFYCEIVRQITVVYSTVLLNGRENSSAMQAVAPYFCTGSALPLCFLQAFPKFYFLRFTYFQFR